MCLAMLAAIAGQALLLGRAILVPYAIGVAAAMWAFVRLYEEPVLRRRFGAEYDAYREAGPGRRPRRRPWAAGG